MFRSSPRVIKNGSTATEGAAHQNAIKDPAGRQSSRLVPDRSITHWLAQEKQLITFVFLCADEAKPLPKDAPRPLAGSGRDSVRDGGRWRCGHVNKSISGPLDRWDLWEVPTPEN